MNSNKELIKELTKDSKNYKIYKIQNYITELQKKKINPLLELSKEIILMQTTNHGFYCSENTQGELGNLKQQICHFTSHMFANLGKYVTNPATLYPNNLIDDVSILNNDREQENDFVPIPEVQRK